MDHTNVLPIAKHLDSINQLRKYLETHILGQDNLITRLLIALLCDGHLLVEGAPGLAKTKAIKTLAAGIDASFHRIQFTPDLLPSDLTGTDIYRPESGQFSFQSGPLFHNMILADEINRAPAKVQAALLEAMEERQVTIGRTSHRLSELFLVMATQNPIEQEGTYPLPEAQLDRFLMYVKVNYPDADIEQQILRLAREEARQKQAHQTELRGSLSQTAILAARKSVLDIHMSPALEKYIVQLVLATRQPARYAEKFGEWLRFGASPRATIGLDRASRAHAWLQQRDFVTPDDIQAIALDVLRHRIILTYEAEALGVTADQFLSELMTYVPVP